MLSALAPFTKQTFKTWLLFPRPYRVFAGSHPDENVVMMLADQDCEFSLVTIHHALADVLEF